MDHTFELLTTPLLVFPSGAYPGNALTYAFAMDAFEGSAAALQAVCCLHDLGSCDLKPEKERAPGGSSHQLDIDLVLFTAAMFRPRPMLIGDLLGSRLFEPTRQKEPCSTVSEGPL